MLLCCFGVVRSLNLAIDLGSAVYKSSSIIDSEIPEPNRAIPAFVAFRARPGFNASSTKPLTEDDTEFLTSDHGEKAIRASEIRPNMTGGYFSALIGLNDSALKRKAANFLIPSNPARLHINDAAAVSLIGYIEAITTGNTIDNLALIFPAYYTLYERLIWTEGLKTMGLTNISEFDDVQAVTFNYIVTKTIDKPHNVLFVDVGATSIKSYAIEFTLDAQKVPTATRLSYSIDKANGGDYLTKSLIGLLRERISVTNTSEAENRRLFAASERAKLELAEHDSSTVIVEIDGVDRSATVTKDEFENKYLDSLVEAVVNVARKASERIKIDVIELIGGASKSKPIETALKKSLRLNPIKRSLDSDNAISIGGSYALQFKLGQSHLSRVNVTTPFSLHNVNFSQIRDSLPLCKSHKICSKNIIRFGLFDRFSIVYEHNDLNSDVAILTHNYRIGKNGFGNVSLHFSPHPLTFLGYDKCNETCIPARFIAQTIPKSSPEIVRLLTNKTAKIERISQLRESLIHATARVLDEIAKNVSVRAFSNSSQRIDVIRCVERERNWSRSSEAAKAADPHVFTSHITEVKRCIAPIYRRLEENRTIWREADRLYRLIERTKQLVGKWRERAGPGDGGSVFRFEQRLERVDGWFNQTIQTILQHQKLWKGMPIRAKQLADKYTELNADVALMKEKFGGARAPRLLKGDGSTPSDKEWSKLNEMPFMKNMQSLEMEEELAAIENDEFNL